MSQDTLAHTLHVRVPLSMRDELMLTAVCEDMTVGQLVRRAIQREMRSPMVRALDPFAQVPPKERLKHLHDAVEALDSDEVAQNVFHEIGNDLVDVMDAGQRSLDVLHRDDDPAKLVRLAGYLQQLSLSTLRAASRVKALRALCNYDDYPSALVKAPETVEG